MCYTRPCWGTPQDFDKILDAGFSSLVQCDYYNRQTSTAQENISILTMALHWKKDGEEEPVSSLLKILFEGVSEDIINADYTMDHTGGKVARLNPSGKCVMLNKENECMLHDIDLKPEQGRKACCKEPHTEDKGNEYYANLWDTDFGRAVVNKWKRLVNFKDYE